MPGLEQLLGTPAAHSYLRTRQGRAAARRTGDTEACYHAWRQARRSSASSINTGGLSRTSSRPTRGSGASGRADRRSRRPRVRPPLTGSRTPRNKGLYGYAGWPRTCQPVRVALRAADRTFGRVAMSRGGHACLMRMRFSSTTARRGRGRSGRRARQADAVLAAHRGARRGAVRARATGRELHGLPPRAPLAAARAEPRCLPPLVPAPATLAGSAQNPSCALHAATAPRPG